MAVTAEGKYVTRGTIPAYGAETALKIIKGTWPWVIELVAESSVIGQAAIVGHRRYVDSLESAHIPGLTR